MLTAIKDVGGVLLLAFLLPVWIAVGLAGIAFVVIRHLYWWCRGNTTETSRPGTHVGPSSSATSAPDIAAADSRALALGASLLDARPAER